METVSSKKKIKAPQSVKVEGELLIILYEGKEHRFKLPELSDRLATASQADRENFVVSAAGYGIHWPTVDEDISIHSLLNKKTSSLSKAAEPRVKYGKK